MSNLENFKTDLMNYSGAVKYPISNEDIEKMDYTSLSILSDKIDNFYNMKLLTDSYKKYDLLKSRLTDED